MPESRGIEDDRAARARALRVVQAPGWLLLLYLLVAQGVAAIDYGLGVKMGTQEAATTITEVGAAFWYGFAVGDLLVYVPLLVLGLVGQLRNAPWHRIVLAAALGITVYWPVVCLAALVDARGAEGWHLADETPYWVVLPLVSAWGSLGLWSLLPTRRRSEASPPPRQPGTRVREVRDGDLDAWAALRHALWPACPLETAREEAAAMLASPDECAWLLWDGEDAVGFAEVRVYDGAGDPYAHVEGWYVDPAYRGRGFGHDLIEALESWCLHRAIYRLTSDTTPDDHPLSEEAHTRAGYRAIRRITIFGKELPSGP